MYLIGAQHFDLSIHDVWEKLAEISQMRDVIARDLWDSTNSAHAQIIDINSGNYSAKQVGTLLLTARHVYAVSKADGDIPESHPSAKNWMKKSTTCCRNDCVIPMIFSGACLISSMMNG